jgi:hypothetical protein
MPGDGLRQEHGRPRERIRDLALEYMNDRANPVRATVAAAQLFMVDQVRDAAWPGDGQDPAGVARSAVMYQGFCRRFRQAVASFHRTGNEAALVQQLETLGQDLASFDKSGRRLSAWRQYKILRDHDLLDDAERRDQRWALLALRLASAAGVGIIGGSVLAAARPPVIYEACAVLALVLVIVGWIAWSIRRFSKDRAQ